MKSKNWLFLLGVLFVVLGFQTFRPVPIPEESDCLTLNGTVARIYESGVKDVFFELKGIDKKFYVNRGLERGLDLNELQAELTNKEILIKYPKYWTPLNPDNSVRHISKIELEGRTIFTELN